MTAVMICLGKAGGENYSGILKLLDVLLSSERSSEEKCRILENEFDIEMTKNLESEVSELCNLSQGVIDRTMLDSICNLMETLKMTVEQAMAALKIPEADQPKYKAMLDK